MRILLALALAAASAVSASALGEGDEEDAVPSMQRTGGILLFYKSTGPMSFVTMTPRDVPRGAALIGEVKGVSCQRGLSIPIAASLRATNLSGGYGDGGYAKALADMRKTHPNLVGIYDVRTDLHVFSILGIYRSLCTEVTARGFSSTGRSNP